MILVTIHHKRRFRNHILIAQTIYNNDSQLLSQYYLGRSDEVLTLLLLEQLLRVPVSTSRGVIIIIIIINH